MRPQDNVVSRRTLLAGVGAAGLTVSIAPRSSAADASVAAQRTRVPLPDGFQPEGITSGPGTTFYAGSVATGRIVTGDLLTGGVRPLAYATDGRSLRGLWWDHRTNLLWAVGNVGTSSRVWAFDATDGGIVSTTAIPGGGFLNDLVVAGNRIWVTDSLTERLAVISLTAAGMPTGRAAAFLPLSGAWPAGDGQALNANGIRRLVDGTLILNNSRVGGLWLVDPDTGVTTSLAVRGGPEITSGDGLVLAGSYLYNVRGTGQSELSVLRLSRSSGTWSGTWVEQLTDSALDVPSTATAAGGAIWAVNARFGTPDPTTASYWVTRLPQR